MLTEDQATAVICSGAAAPGGPSRRGPAPVRPPLLRSEHERSPPLLGRYVLLERLGAGGMGEVWSAFDTTLDRMVAVKLLNDGRRSVAGELRLRREGQGLAKLSHPNVVQVYDVGTHDGVTYLAMELVHGETLGAWLKRERPSWREVRDVFLAAGQGLVAAHAVGLVHRDFKPDNVLLSRDGAVKVTDFGLARSFAAEESSTLDGISPADSSAFGCATAITTVTRPGVVLGTPGYLAPEILRQASADTRSDQFAFCVSLYLALYRERPFDPKESIDPRRFSPARRPPASDVPRWLQSVVMRGLSLAPEQRFSSMSELLSELTRDTRERSDRRWLLLAVLGVGLIAAGAFPSSGAREPCAVSLDGAWDDDVRAAARRALVVSERAEAGAAFERLDNAINAYASSWRATRDEVCAAPTSRAHDEMRADCLRTRAQELSALTTLMTAASGAVDVGHATAALAELEHPGACRTREALVGRVMAPPKAHAATIARLQNDLARASVLRGAARFTEVKVQVDRVVDGARQLAYEPLLARALVLLGATQYDQADFVAATRSFEEAVAAAERGGDDEARADALSRLVNTYAIGNRVELAERTLESLRSLVQRLGGEGHWRRRERAADGAVAWRRGEGERAERAFEDALRIAAKLFGPADLRTANAYANLALAKEMRGDLEAAISLTERHLEVSTRALGPRSLRVLRATTKLCGVLVTTGRLADARARCIPAFTLASEPERLNSIRWDLAGVIAASFAEAGDHDEAARWLRTSKSALSTLPEDARQVATHAMLVQALGLTGQCEEAKEAARALPTEPAALARLTSSQRALVMAAPAFLEVCAGRMASGARRAEQALLEANGTLEPDVALDLATVAATLRRRAGHCRRSLRSLEVALARAQAQGIGDDPLRASAALLELGRCQSRLGQVTSAVRTLERAKALRGQLQSSRLMADVELALTRAHARLGRSSLRSASPRQ